MYLHRVFLSVGEVVEKMEEAYVLPALNGVLVRAVGSLRSTTRRRLQDPPSVEQDSGAGRALQRQARRKTKVEEEEEEEEKKKKKNLSLHTRCAKNFSYASDMNFQQLAMLNYLRWYKYM